MSNLTPPRTPLTINVSLPDGSEARLTKEEAQDLAVDLADFLDLMLVDEGYNPVTRETFADE